MWWTSLVFAAVAAVTAFLVTTLVGRSVNCVKEMKKLVVFGAFIMAFCGAINSPWGVTAAVGEDGVIVKRGLLPIATFLTPAGCRDDGLETRDFMGDGREFLFVRSCSSNEKLVSLKLWGFSEPQVSSRDLFVDAMVKVDGEILVLELAEATRCNSCTCWKYKQVKEIDPWPSRDRVVMSELDGWRIKSLRSDASILAERDGTPYICRPQFNEDYGWGGSWDVECVLGWNSLGLSL